MPVAFAFGDLFLHAVCHDGVDRFIENEQGILFTAFHWKSHSCIDAGTRRIGWGRDFI